MKLRFLFVSSLFLITLCLVPLQCGGIFKELRPKNVPPKIPVVFHSSYDIGFCGLEKLHPLDSKKYGKIYNFLVDELNTQTNNENNARWSKIYYHFSKSVNREQFYTPEMVSDTDLLKVHTQEYLDSLNTSSVVASIAEIPPLSLLPNFLVRRFLLNPMKYATGGTILAAQLAVKDGWAINLSGGYHHAKSDGGSGFCVYADIPLAIYKLQESNPDLKVMIVDLDAHQGNGHEAICGNDKRVAIYDIYNQDIYPADFYAKQLITFNHPVHSFIDDKAYLELLEMTLPKALEAFNPDLIIYNAGTDIYEKDPLGRMKVSESGIIQRDEFVFNLYQFQIKE